MSEYQKICKELSSRVKSLYEKTFTGKGKVPSRLNKLSKTLLKKYPNNFFFRAIEIKSFIEEADKELDDCFPGDFFPNDNEKFSGDIYSFLNSNIKNFENNDIIIQGIKVIIGNLKPDSYIKKYISLIDIIAKHFNDENRILCDLLASNPFKYTDLRFIVNENLNVSPLPKTAVEFYSINRYSTNIDKFSKYSKGIDDIAKLREELLQKISEQNQKIFSQDQKILLQNQAIDNLKLEVDQLKKESKDAKNVLFKIQIRDVIKAFVNDLFWTLNEQKKTLDNINDVETKLKQLAGNSNAGVEMIVNLLKNLKTLKDSGDDGGHHINNIGFSEDILPEEIRNEYAKLKKNPNCGIKNCDCIALLLSVKEINDSFPEMTKKKYDLLENLIKIPAKDWENNKKLIGKLLNSY